MNEELARAHLGASDIDRAFLQAMVPHHEMAIDMAKMAQQKARNPTIKSMADQIVRTQGEEIEKMKAIYLRLFGNEFVPDNMAYQALSLTMEESGMKMDMKMIEDAKDFDIVFAEQMIIHHQSAINMARKILKTATTDEEIQNLAEAIIKAQTKEIEILKTIRK